MKRIEFKKKEQGRKERMVIALLSLVLETNFFHWLKKQTMNWIFWGSVSDIFTMFFIICNIFFQIKLILFLIEIIAYKKVMV